MFTSRNGIAVNDALVDGDIIDTIYETCDAEFSSRADVHNSFARASGMFSWARYYLTHEIRRIAIRDNIGWNLSRWQCLQIAQRISKDWFTTAV